MFTDTWRSAMKSMENALLDNAAIKKDEEWIWVKGYKGMDKNMRCKNDFQYEIGAQYDMPKDDMVTVCASGFHLCLKLKDVFRYYDIEDGNRFFEVEALVRKSDAEDYGHPSMSLYSASSVDKLAAKSIRIVRELNVEEILAPYPETADWDERSKQIAITEGFDKAIMDHRIRVMVEMGYAKPLAKYICCDQNAEDGFKLAVALDSQPGISMDTKINAIFSHI